MKYALVTGGSRGIGKAVCIQLAGMGYHVLINYLSNKEEAQNTLETINLAGGKEVSFSLMFRIMHKL